MFDRKDNKDEADREEMDRRKFISAAALLTGGLLMAEKLAQASSFSRVIPADAGERYKIGVSDWMILKRQKPGAFALAKTIGADGVEVDMGGLGNRPTFDNKLADPAVLQNFLAAASSLNMEICSVAMSAFFAQSFAERSGVEDMVKGCIGMMKAMKVKVAFLPMGVQGDLIKHPQLRPQIVERLKAAAVIAEQAGVVIGIETSLDAAGEVKLLSDIGSSAIQSYFNFKNPVQAGRDLCKELKILGKNRICQIHCTDKDGVWLQNDPLINMHEVKRTLDEMGWSGWLVMERSRDARDPHNVKKNYGANAAYLKSIFRHE